MMRTRGRTKEGKLDFNYLLATQKIYENLVLIVMLINTFASEVH